MKITKQDLLSLSYTELRDLNKMVVEELKRKRTIESLEKSSTINVGDIVTSSYDGDKEQFCVKEIKRVKIVGESLITGIKWNIPIASLTISKSAE